MKLSDQMGNRYEIIPLNIPGGSTLQRGMVQGQLCLTALVRCYTVSTKKKKTESQRIFSLILFRNDEIL